MDIEKRQKRVEKWREKGERKLEELNLNLKNKMKKEDEKKDISINDFLNISREKELEHDVDIRELDTGDGTACGEEEAKEIHLNQDWEDIWERIKVKKDVESSEPDDNDPSGEPSDEDNDSVEIVLPKPQVIPMQYARK